MSDRIEEYDLSPLMGHEIECITFTSHMMVLGSVSTNDDCGEESARVVIECPVNFNGADVERVDLLGLISQVYLDCWIDLNFDLHLKFESGDELIVLRKDTGFESYSIHCDRHPEAHVVIM